MESSHRWKDAYSRRFLFFVFVILAFSVVAVNAQQDSKCSALKPCKSGCCGKTGNCGFGPDYCGDGCQGTCNAQAECGQYAPHDSFECPLKVCCSKWGFCGTTSEFCNSECQNKDGCPPIYPPLTCTERTDAADMEVRIGYYNMGGASRPCDAMQPEGIAAGALTHINVAFGTINGHTMTDETEALVARVSTLKKKYPGLRVNIAIDWEYPVARDRGGAAEDYDNFVKLCAEIRRQFTREDPGWELTITLPSSYWYLRGFNLADLQKVVDWFNVMSYDIHGLWDQKNIWTGPYLKGHTNLTEIKDGLDLLWRNGVDPQYVVMGYGFYGRSFTMSDSTCTTPDGCTFSGAGFAGDCTNEAGILSYAEVMSKNKELGSTTHYDEASSVKYMVYGGNQWISFDDEESFTAKKKFQSKLCLKGLMIWAVDLDTNDYQAMTALMGEKLMVGALDGKLNPRDKEHLVSDLSAWTGQGCYVETECATNKELWADGKARCQSGYMPIAQARAPRQIDADYVGKGETCDAGRFKQVCCPIKTAPHHCTWSGAPDSGDNVCKRGCGSTEFELTDDPFTGLDGEHRCSKGKRSLCCDSTPILQKCRWTDCGYQSDRASLCKDDEVKIATRMDKDNEGNCPGYTGMGNGGQQGPTRHQYYRSFCCPKNDPFENCRWSNTDSGSNKKLVARTDRDTGARQKCIPRNCGKDELKITEAEVPDTLYDVENGPDGNPCLLFYPEDSGPEFSLCCDPPSVYSKKWPVEPSYLWSHAYSDKNDDVTWEFADDFGNNNADTVPNDMDTDPGKDPYGFVMLDGPPGSINNAFGKDFTVVQDEEPTKNMKRRSFVTTNSTILETTFDHAEEMIRVFCNHPADSIACRRMFYKGARDKIIKLPDHVGEGPYARVVSMEPETEPGSMPSWAIRKRTQTQNSNGVYVLKFDYNFLEIQARDDEQVNMRVDFTNLMDYWDTITAAKPDKKRSLDDHMPFQEWKSHVEKARASGNIAQHPEKGSGTTKFTATAPPSRIVKRWFGSFLDWLKKVTTITKDEKGVIPMGLRRVFTLFSGRLHCENDAGVTITAGLDITTEFNLDMQARYAYYFSGTVVPPAIIDTYAYVGAQPKIYAGITIDGNANLGYESPTKRLITTLTYPGLSIKGIATIGPSLDVWGRIDGSLRVSGHMKTGVSYTFSPIDVYLPNDDKGHDSAPSELSSSQVDQLGLQPTFEANVKAEVDFNVRVTPEINMGIVIGGSIGPLKKPLVDAHVAAFTNTSLNFNATAEAGVKDGSGHWRYGYSINFLYRVGITCVAEIIKYGRWQSQTYYPVDWQKIPLYSKEVSSINDGKKRSVKTEEPLPDAVFQPEPASSPCRTLPMQAPGGFMIGANSSLNRLSKRDEIEFSIGGSAFKCNTNAGSVCASEGEPIAARAVNASLVLGKRAPITDCRAKLPLLLYNCATAFMDISYTGETGTKVEIPGICSNIKRFFKNRSYIGDGWGLTWDPDGQGPRRNQVCNRYCQDDNASRLKDTFKDPKDPKKVFITNCDEFPIASSEQGGRGWYGVEGTDTGGTTRTCVPEWQNALQGNCNSLLNNLYTNLEYFNDADNPSGELPDSAWASWSTYVKTGGTKGWLTKKGLGGRQRLTKYDDEQPSTAGQNQAEKANKHLSWFHKRNFTLRLVTPDPDNSPDTAWPNGKFNSGTLKDKSDKKSPPPATYTVSNSAWVFCAVNTQGQKRYRVKSFNGLCWDGQTYYTDGLASAYYQVRTYYSCQISFDGSPYVERRGEPLGYMGDVPYYRKSGYSRGAKSYNFVSPTSAAFRRVPLTHQDFPYDSVDAERYDGPGAREFDVRILVDHTTPQAAAAIVPAAEKLSV